MINQILKEMSIQKKLLLSNICIILVSFTLVYAMLLFMLIYKLDFFAFTASQDFITVMILSILFFVGFKIIYNAVDRQELKHLKKESRRKRKQRHHKTSPPTNNLSTSHKLTGTWHCPVCNNLAKGAFCNNCGHKYE